MNWGVGWRELETYRGEGGRGLDTNTRDIMGLNKNDYWIFTVDFLRQNVGSVLGGWVFIQISGMTLLL